MEAMVKRRALAAVIAAILAGAVAAIARANTNNEYAGPKTWLAGYYASDYFDGTYYGGAPIPWWFINGMYDKSCASCWSRITFIKPDGTWTYSYTSTGTVVNESIPSGSEAYEKKPYCKNNDTATYTADCWDTSD
jgi:hypothetical protein